MSVVPDCSSDWVSGVPSVAVVDDGSFAPEREAKDRWTDLILSKLGFDLILRCNKYLLDLDPLFEFLLLGILVYLQSVVSVIGNDQLE